MFYSFKELKLKAKDLLIKKINYFQSIIIQIKY